MTFLDVINKVLTRLREDTVSSSTASDYATLIAEFVSEIHQEVALAHDWGSGYKNVVFDCVASQRTYDLSDDVNGSGDVVAGGNLTNAGSEPAALGNAYLYNTSSSTEPRSVVYLTENSILENMINEDTDADDVPCNYTLTLKSDGSGFEADLYPLPNDTYRISIPMWIPETVLETDTTDDTTNINLPTRPIILGALYLALNERGEEIGEPGNMAERRYYDALDAAVAADNKVRQLTNRYEWVRS